MESFSNDLHRGVSFLSLSPVKSCEKWCMKYEVYEGHLDHFCLCVFSINEACSFTKAGVLDMRAVTS